MTRTKNNNTDIWPPRDSTNIKRNQSQTFDFPCKYIVAKRPIGEGSYSTVYECKDTKTSSHYAAKRYNKKLIFGFEDMLQNEFMVLKSVSRSHRNLLNLVDYFETEKYLYLVTDLAQGGELFNRVTENTRKKLSEQETMSITTQLVDAVEYLHSMNIVHRDIKAENILFHSPHSNIILLADFGLARVVNENTRMADIGGTLSYMAPEMLARQEYRYSVDMWAIGVTVYFMLCGYMPFDCEADDETKEAIMKGDYMFEPKEYWKNISGNAKSFIQNCFVIDPNKRMSLPQARQHPFLQQNTKSNMSRSSTAIASNRATASLELLQNLKQQLMHADLASAKDASSSRSYLESSRANYTPDSPLEGALCHSPSSISVFTTPVTSADMSPAASEEMPRVDLKRVDYSCAQTQPTFFI